jgi:hypothetical protein
VSLSDIRPAPARIDHASTGGESTSTRVADTCDP